MKTTKKTTEEKAEFLYDFLHSCESQNIDLLYAIAQLRSFGDEELNKVSTFIDQLWFGHV